MKDLVIKAENISKQYRLGVLDFTSLKDEWKMWWAKRSPERKPPANTGILADEKIAEKYIWALRNISFEVKQGEVLAIIGKNGAGKSTLLKIISRISLPTTGIIKGKGRIASLLEVGTGFHNELTGRENIFLNGQILGMKKKEVAEKFDEIVDFSGIEKFLDTPIKRYSSGMYVRLAFAVAAHLDPEILLVDEVLAVGDAEFQRKCLGKMKDSSIQDGKTILFVSHNMQAVRNLCQRAILLEGGQIVDEGNPENVIAGYINKATHQRLIQEFNNPQTAPGNEHIRIKKVLLTPRYTNHPDIMDIRTPLLISFEFWYHGHKDINLMCGVHLFTISGECIFDVCSPKKDFKNGLIKGECLIPGNFLNDGSYYISIIFVKDSSSMLFYYEECLSFHLEDHREDIAWYGKWIGYVRPKFDVQLHQNKIEF
ncbi:ABC transporter ATP-binding protein [Terrimonas alba]|uniref:ABC transporter ATP-binding protein n=1 Tax=Terrimonas alba TaxID=3349636 RepID=UPI0035F43E70